MNKKISLGLAIALIFISITATFALTIPLSENIYNSLISRLSNRFELYEGISAIDNYVRTNFYGDFDDDALFADSASGYMKGLDDVGSFYMTAQEYIEYTRRMKGEGGIGIDAMYDAEKASLIITEVYSESSAEKAELQKDDVIIAVDGETVTAENSAGIIDSLRFGRRFDSVNITYVRDGAEKTVTVMRGFTKTVSSSFLGNVGYVKITGFYENTAEQFTEEMDKLNAEGVTSLIIDVRGCSDGSVDYAAAVADQLLPSGVESADAIASAVKKDGTNYKNFTSDTKALTFPGGIIVLTDGGTSGGAELIVAQLRDFSKAQILGVTTAGEMTLQEIYALEDGSAISLTVAKVVSYSGNTYCDGNGIDPDVLVEIDPSVKLANSLDDIGQDSQLSAAYTKITQ